MFPIQKLQRNFFTSSAGGPASNSESESERIQQLVAPIQHRDRFLRNIWIKNLSFVDLLQKYFWNQYSSTQKCENFSECKGLLNLSDKSTHKNRLSAWYKSECQELQILWRHVLVESQSECFCICQSIFLACFH